MIPRTTTFKEYKAKRARARIDESLLNGQTTLDGTRSLPQRPAEIGETHRNSLNNKSLTLDETVDDDDGAEDFQVGPTTRRGAAALQQFKPNGSARHDESEDIEMG